MICTITYHAYKSLPIGPKEAKSVSSPAGSKTPSSAGSGEICYCTAGSGCRHSRNQLHMLLLGDFSDSRSLACVGDLVFLTASSFLRLSLNWQSQLYISLSAGFSSDYELSAPSPAVHANLLIPAFQARARSNGLHLPSFACHRRSPLHETIDYRYPLFLNQFI